MQRTKNLALVRYNRFVDLQNFAIITSSAHVWWASEIIITSLKMDNSFKTVTDQNHMEPQINVDKVAPILISYFVQNFNVYVLHSSFA